MGIGVLVVLLLLTSLSQGAIISQSTISDCSWGDEAEPTAPGGEVCKKKMLISMVLGSGQGNTESLHANVDKAHEQGNEGMSVLKKPFRIELRKTAVLASYRTKVIGTANANPKEKTIHKKHCEDDYFSSHKRLPCGMQYDKNGRSVWDSQGFCCRCDSLNKLYNVRGDQSCGLAFFQAKGSAHCMKMDDLWYDVFTIEMPMMQYRITLDVFELQGITVNDTGSKNVNWTLVSTFHLSPSRTVSRSKSGRVIAEVQGSLLGSKAIRDLSTKRLLIPSVRMWPKKKPYPTPYTNGPNDWMLVDNSKVELAGTECNKIGVNYAGFRRQPGRCNTPSGFCFHNQPLQLWNRDNKLRKKKRSGRYMIHNYGKVHHSSHPNKDSFILKFVHADLHNSFITLRIDASDITFVKSVSIGRIVETYTTPFKAAVGHGTLTVEVGNTGEVSSEYALSVVKCTSGLFEIPAKKLTLEPGEVKNVTFTLRSTEIEGGAKECEVQLYDSTYNVLDMAKINIKVDSACLCFGICGCACDDGKKEVDCSNQSGPPTLYKPGPIVITLFMMLLESIGAHGFIAFFGGLLLILGFIKLSCGGILCCRKTKQQEYAQRMVEKGVPPKSPLLVQCSGECRGAKAAKARYTRKVQRLKQAGKSPHRLDDWRNTSFECQCKSELTDVRFVHVVKAACFFYFCCLLPFIWIGRRVVWRVFKDTAEKKAKAEQEVLLRAKKKGNLEKYGVIDLATELKKFEDDAEGKPSANEGDSEVTQALVMNIDYTSSGKGTDDTESVEAHKKVNKFKVKPKDKQPKMKGQAQQILSEIEHGVHEQSASLQPHLTEEKMNQGNEHLTEHDPCRDKGEWRHGGERTSRGEKARGKEKGMRKWKPQRKLTVHNESATMSYSSESYRHYSHRVDFQSGSEYVQPLVSSQAPQDDVKSTDVEKAQSSVDKSFESQNNALMSTHSSLHHSGSQTASGHICKAMEHSTSHINHSVSRTSSHSSHHSASQGSRSASHSSHISHITSFASASSLSSGNSSNSAFQTAKSSSSVTDSGSSSHRDCEKTVNRDTSHGDTTGVHSEGKASDGEGGEYHDESASGSEAETGVGEPKNNSD